MRWSSEPTLNRGCSGSTVRTAARSVSAGTTPASGDVQGQVNIVLWTRRQVEVESLLTARCSQIEILHAPDHADDRVRFRLVRATAKKDALADRIAGGKILAFEDSVDDDGRGMRFPVRTRENPATQNRDSHRLEIVLVDAATRGMGLSAGRRAPDDAERDSGIGAGERHDRCCSRRSHAWHVAHHIQDRTQVAGLGRGIRKLRRRQSQRGD